MVQWLDCVRLARLTGVPQSSASFLPLKRPARIVCALLPRYWQVGRAANRRVAHPVSFFIRTCAKGKGNRQRGKANTQGRPSPRELSSSPLAVRVAQAPP